MPGFKLTITGIFNVYLASFDAGPQSSYNDAIHTLPKHRVVFALATLA